MHTLCMFNTYISKSDGWVGVLATCRGNREVVCRLLLTVATGTSE